MIVEEGGVIRRRLGKGYLWEDTGESEVRWEKVRVGLFIVQFIRSQ